jgi:hypothetical protein
VSTSSDGSDREPVARPVQQTGRPPVPVTAPSEDTARRDDESGWHRTEQVPFPLPPLPPGDARPAAVPGPATGQLDLSGYPPRVPGGRRPDAATAAPDEDAPA